MIWVRVSKVLSISDCCHDMTNLSEEQVRAFDNIFEPWRPIFFQQLSNIPDINGFRPSTARYKNVCAGERVQMEVVAELYTAVDDSPV